MLVVKRTIPVRQDRGVGVAQAGNGIVQTDNLEMEAGQNF